MLDRPVVWAGLWALIAVLLAVAAVPAIVDSPPNAPPRLLYTALGGMLAVCGLLAWRRRPENHSGRWMLAAGLGFFW
jgi:MYXO-CTERM domain-containing protein